MEKAFGEYLNQSCTIFMFLTFYLVIKVKKKLRVTMALDCVII